MSAAKKTAKSKSANKSGSTTRNKDEATRGVDIEDYNYITSPEHSKDAACEIIEQLTKVQQTYPPIFLISIADYNSTAQSWDIQKLDDLMKYLDQSNASKFLLIKLIFLFLIILLIIIDAHGIVITDSLAEYQSLLNLLNPFSENSGYRHIHSVYAQVPSFQKDQKHSPFNNSKLLYINQTQHMHLDHIMEHAFILLIC